MSSYINIDINDGNYIDDKDYENENININTNSYDDNNNMKMTPLAKPTTTTTTTSLFSPSPSPFLGYRHNGVKVQKQTFCSNTNTHYDDDDNNNDIDNINIDLNRAYSYSNVNSNDKTNSGLRRNRSLDSITTSSGFVRADKGIEMAMILQGNVLMPRKSSKKIIQQDSKPDDINDWEYPGWGDVFEKNISKDDLPKRIEKHQLDVYRSVGIAGNDLLASVLYTTGILCAVCGQLAPFAMILAVLALHPFRKIFKECGTALPLNGGVYVALLNSCSKFIATFAASCSLISYSATAVVSASSCTTYAYNEFGEFPMLLVTVGILAIFALLVILGVKDSANLAFFIFSCHMITLIILIITCIVAIINNNGSILYNNYLTPLGTSNTISYDLFIGYSVSLLGLTGFETSANYIEEIGPFETEKNKVGPTRRISVFEKTIDSMWYLVAFINPTIALLTLGTVPLPEIVSNATNILSIVAERSGGKWLRTIVGIDAILVLCGGVLTAFVGVVGLVRQLASDRCLPSFLLAKNTWFDTYHWIILSFFTLCSALYLMTNGDVVILSGVFAIAFLMVLIMFALANMSLKINRPRLPRGVTASWGMVLTGFFAMIIGIIGNIINNITLLYYFLIYLFFYFSIILIKFNEMPLTKLLLYFVTQVPILHHFEEILCERLKKMKRHTVVFFTTTSELHILNKALLYSKYNELCDQIIICNIRKSNKGAGKIQKILKENMFVLDHLYPKTKIDLLLVTADEFSPEVVQYLSQILKVERGHYNYYHSFIIIIIIIIIIQYHHYHHYHYHSS